MRPSIQPMNRYYKRNNVVASIHRVFGRLLQGFFFLIINVKFIISTVWDTPKHPTNE
jgi:hypothetical protein